MARLQADRGHGSNTFPPSKGVYASGGVPGLEEHDFNAAVMDEAERLLKGKLATFSAQGSNKPDVPLWKRTQQYNADFGKDPKAVGMSAHANANENKSVRGFGVFYWEGSAEGKRLAQLVLDEYKREFPDLPLWGSGIHVSRRGTWSEFAILRDTYAPFVLIEFEFFTNDEARKLLLSADYRKRCGAVVARSAAKWYGIKLDDKPAAKAAADPLHKGWLQINDRGTSVSTLQQNLNKFANVLKIKPIVVDGIFGAVTRDALKLFQRHFKIAVDGYYGKESIATMKKQLQALAEAEKAEAKAKADKLAKEAAAKAKGAMYRVIVNGKQAGAYSVNDNALRAAERAIEAGARNIVIEKV